MIPRVHVGWHDVWTGAAVTSLLFTIGKFLIGLYLGKSDVTSSFGAAGSLVIMMVWVYYSAQIFLFGAEFTWVYANMYGSRRNEAAQEKAARTAESEVPTRSDTGTIPTSTVAARGESAPSAGSTVPSGAAPFVDRGHPALSQPRPAPISPAPETRAPREHNSPVHAARVLVRNNRTALGIALTTAILVGVVARFGAVKRLARSVIRPRHGAAHRRLAS
jgi:hypothetical protein